MPWDFCCRSSVRFERVQPGGFGGFTGQRLAGVMNFLVEERASSTYTRNQNGVTRFVHGAAFGFTPGKRYCS